MQVLKHNSELKKKVVKDTLLKENSSYDIVYIYLYFLSERLTVLIVFDGFREVAGVVLGF